MILIFSIAMGADYSFELISIIHWVRQFFMHNKSILGGVDIETQMGRSSSSLSVPVMLRQNNAGVGYFFHDYEIIIISWLYILYDLPLREKSLEKGSQPRPPKNFALNDCCYCYYCATYVFWRDFICLHTWLPFPLNQFASNFVWEFFRQINAV